jgi:hypothetical protein
MGISLFPFQRLRAVAFNIYQSEYIQAWCVKDRGFFWLVQNSFPMREWHVEHMEKTVVKYVKGLSENASGWEKRNHKKYGSLANISRQIEYDIKHGVTSEQVISLFEKIRNDSSFSTLRKGSGSMERLAEIESQFSKPKIRVPQWH